MFNDVLKQLVDGLDDAIAAVVMEATGVTLDSYAKDGAEFDISAVGVEYGVALGAIKRAAESLSAGATEEVLIRTDKLVSLIRVLGETYFFVVAMKPEANLGKGRYLMRTAAPKIVAEL